MSNEGVEPKTSAWALWLAWVGTFLLFACVAHGNFETTDAGFTMFDFGESCPPPSNSNSRAEAQIVNV